MHHVCCRTQNRVEDDAVCQGWKGGWEGAVAQEGWSLGQESRGCCWRNQNEQGMDGEAVEGRQEVLREEPLSGARILVSSLGPAKRGECEGPTLTEGA